MRPNVFVSSRMMPGWLLAAVALPRVIVLILAGMHPSYRVESDSTNYTTLAKNLWDHHAFFVQPLLPETYRVPGYPLFLVPFVALFQNFTFWVAGAQTLIGLVTLYLFWSWVSTYASERGTAVATLFLGWDLVVLLHTPIVLSETLYLFLITVAAASVWKLLNHAESRRYATDGFLWGLAVLVRPVGMFLPPVLSLLWLHQKKNVFIFLTAFALCPGLWILRNTMVGHYRGISSQGGIDLLTYPAASVEALRQGISLEQARAQLDQTLNADHPAGFATPMDKEKAAGHLAIRTITHHPLIFLRYEIHGAVKILGGTGLEMLLTLVVPGADRGPAELNPTVTGGGALRLLKNYPALIPFEILYVLMLLAGYGLFAAGTWKLLTYGEIRQAAFLVLGVLYFLAIASHIATYRQRIPMMPFLAAGIAAGLGPLNKNRRD